MANYKRKRSKRQVRCTICTTYRWLGNHKARRPFRDRRNNARAQDTEN